MKLAQLQQYYWGFTKVFYKNYTGDSTKLENHSNKMLKQIEAAMLFGNIDLFIIGDSNAANLNKLKPMLQLSQYGSVVNIGIGGTTSTDWNEFFKTANGRTIFNIIKANNSKVVFNIGGNHVLQHSESDAPFGLQDLKNLFPESYNCLIPPIRYSLISGILNRSPIELKQGIQKVNMIINNLWTNRVIDTYSPFVNYADKDNQESYLFVQKDGIHFSDEISKKIRIPIILNAIK